MIDSVLMPGVTVAPHAVVRRAVVGPDTVVAENARVGDDGPITLLVDRGRGGRKVVVE